MGASRNKFANTSKSNASAPPKPVHDFESEKADSAPYRPPLSEMGLSHFQEEPVMK
jgi:hypothetical protein